MSVAWSDTFPVAYGAHPSTNCAAIGENVGPIFANEYSGSYARAFCPATGPNTENGTYVHHGWWDANNQRQLGTASIWLR